MVVFVEPAVLQDLNLRSNLTFSSVIEKLSTFRPDSPDKVDFIICLGGDGTLLYASSLFQVELPVSRLNREAELQAVQLVHLFVEQEMFVYAANTDSI